MTVKLALTHSILFRSTESTFPVAAIGALNVLIMLAAIK